MNTAAARHSRTTQPNRAIGKPKKILEVSPSTRATAMCTDGDGAGQAGRCGNPGEGVNVTGLGDAMFISLCAVAFAVALAVALGGKAELLGVGMAVVVNSCTTGAAVVVAAVVFVSFVSFVSFAAFVVFVALPVSDAFAAEDGPLLKVCMLDLGGCLQ